ncbi:hypothetical protein, partial [Raoultella ornithinolytica]|uniref:hypothetical protein n=1 Tax=Raoultella ornithinolytica TaxID=54291 RepID=UPI00292AE3EA
TDWRISLAQGTESLGCHFALSRNRPLTAGIVSKESFVAEAQDKATKKTLKMQGFKMDMDSLALLQELAFTLCGNNKTMAVKAGLLALKSLSEEQQREIIRELYQNQ